MPSGSDALALTVVAPFTKTEVVLRGVGDVIATVGDVGLTATMVTLTFVETAWLP